MIHIETQSGQDLKSELEGAIRKAYRPMVKDELRNIMVENGYHHTGESVDSLVETDTGLASKSRGLYEQEHGMAPRSLEPGEFEELVIWYEDKLGLNPYQAEAAAATSARNYKEVGQPPRHVLSEAIENVNKSIGVPT